MKKRLFITGSLGFVLYLGLSSTAHGALEAHSGRWKLTARGSRSCSQCPSGMAFDFAADDAQTGTTQRFSIGNMMDSVETVALFDSKAIIVGNLGVSGDIVTVYDLLQNKVTDEFYGLYVTLSPDRRLAAFLRFYPHFTDPANRSSVVMLYDFSRTPDENRAPKTKATSAKSAGLPVFPEKNRLSQQPDPYQDQRNWVYPEFGWSPSSRFLAFLDEEALETEIGQQGYVFSSARLVLVDVPGKIEDAKVTVRRVSKDDLLRPEFKGDKFTGFHIDKLSVGTDGSIDLINKASSHGTPSRFKEHNPFDLRKQYDERY